MTDREWRPFLLKWMGLALVFHLVASWFSQGHHSVDEYFQILEFLSYKRGVTPPGDLAAEWHEKMRPWMQPFLYGQVVKLWELAGVLNPFVWAWSFRLITGLVGWASCVVLAERAREWFVDDERAQRFAVYGLALMWFLPAMHVRPSSEGLCGSAFLLGLGLLTAKPRGGLGQGLSLARWLGGGALLGLSFEARFQMGFMIVGFVAWLALMRRPRIRVGELAALVVGLGVVFALGRWIDRWGYGEWVLSPWRYVEYNLLRGEVNRYGRSPPWDVFRMAFTESWPLLGFGLALASVVAWIRHPRHPLTWAQVPFFLVHIAIAHKELRFFFPIAVAGPVLLTMALSSGKELARRSFVDPAQAAPGWLGRLTRYAWFALLANNGVALVALLLLPFARPVEFYHEVWRKIGETGSQRFEILYRGSPADDPYRMLGNPVYFYRPPELVTTAFASYEALAARIAAGESLWVFDPGFDLPPEAAPIASQCKPAIRTLPTWITALNFNGWLARAHPWTLFNCKKEGA